MSIMKGRPVLGLGAAAVLVLGLLLVAGGQELQRQPGFCANCHRAAYDDWRASGAAKSHGVCVECHSGAGVVEALKAEFGGGVRIAEFFGGADPAEAKAEVPNANCAKCHADRERVAGVHHRGNPPQAGLSYCGTCHTEQLAGEATLRGRPTACGACHSHTGEGGFGAPHPLRPR